MEGVAREREELRRRVIEELRPLADSLAELWGAATVVLVGSYARGDFGAWSDIDLLVVVEEGDPNPLRRYDRALPALVRAGLPVELVILTKPEFVRGLKRGNPIVVEAVRAGVVLRDDLRLFRRQPRSEGGQP